MIGISQDAPFELSITLRWPDAKLSPNARGHWSKKARANKTAMTEVMCLLPHSTRIPEGSMVAGLKFYQPDLRPRDVDNLIACMKPYIDAIFRLGKANDNQIEEINSKKLPPDGNARVELKISLIP